MLDDDVSDGGHNDKHAPAVGGQTDLFADQPHRHRVAADPNRAHDSPVPTDVPRHRSVPLEPQIVSKRRRLADTGEPGTIRPETPLLGQSSPHRCRTP
jgi:hypothetical protein